MRVFEYYENGYTGVVKWVAAPDREAADKAAKRKGWTHGHEIFIDNPGSVPKDRKGLVQLGCDLVVGK